MQIDIAGTQRRNIELHGLIGAFSVPGQSITVHFFSTAANSREQGSPEHDLLTELMPMRERVRSSELHDLNALLQRDLNDARVAHELVPYLKGLTSSGIAFFPAILAALIPKGFIEGEGGTYPVPDEVQTPAGPQLNFGECWSVQHYLDKDKRPLPLGKLTLYPVQTNVIVLDGQHRANAFRFVSGVFGQDDDIYSAFYQTTEPPERFDADLPVTLIWFTSDGDEVEPTFVSRNLFVAVNTNAKKVSTSRNILLDDRHVSSLVTRFFLSKVAESASFEPGRFSLLHSGFDLDSDLAERAGHVLTLTNPELLEYTVSWLLLGSRRYNDANFDRVSQERKRSDIGEFEEVFQGPLFTGNQIWITPQSRDVIVRDPDDLPAFEQAYRGVLHPVLYGILNDFSLLQPHYQACEAIAQWQSAQVPKVREVWSKVFGGGEGLYYALRYYDKQGVERGSQLSTLLAGIEEIEQEFAMERAERFTNVSGTPEDHVRRINRVFDSFRTKAFHVGLFMALDRWKGEDTFLDAYEEFRNLLNAITPDQWAYLLYEVKGELFDGVNPKSWPAYQNLILRCIQDEGQFFNDANFRLSPDGQIFEKRVRKSFDVWIENVDAEKPLALDAVDSSLQRSWGQDAKAYVDELFERAGMTPLVAKAVDEAKKVVEHAVNKYNNG